MTFFVEPIESQESTMGSPAPTPPPPGPASAVNGWKPLPATHVRGFSQRQYGAKRGLVR